MGFFCVRVTDISEDIHAVSQFTEKRRVTDSHKEKTSLVFESLKASATTDGSTGVSCDGYQRLHSRSKSNCKNHTSVSEECEPINLQSCVSRH